jgi:hypothetical protein
MAAPLNNFETEVLNKILPTGTFANPPALQVALRTIINEMKEHLLSTGISEQEYNKLAVQTPKIIFQFLRDNEFYYEREGGVFYITEKGKQLRAQGTLEKYIAWREQQHLELKSEMKENEERGYTDKALKEKNEMKLQEKKKRSLVPVFILLAIIVILIVAHFLKLI